MQNIQRTLKFNNKINNPIKNGAVDLNRHIAKKDIQTAKYLTLLVGMQNDTLEDRLVVPYNTKHTIITMQSVIVLLGSYTKKLNAYVHAKTYMQMFIVALFISAQTWKQSKCPSVCEWINELWFIQTIEYYSVIKINELSSHKEKT